MDAQTTDYETTIPYEPSGKANARSQGDRKPQSAIDIALGIAFALALILLFVVVGYALYQLETRSTRLNALAASGNQIVSDAHTMRQSVEERAASLERISKVRDAYERSVEVRRFFSLGRVYDEALAKLAPQINENRLQMALDKVKSVYAKARSASDKTVSLLRTDELLSRITESADQAAETYHAVLPEIDTLLQIQHDITTTALANADVDFAEKRQIVLIAGGSLLALVALLGTLILRRTIRRARQLSWGAHHDALTGLLNRQELELRIDRAMGSAKDRGARHCLLYLDLTGHKQISDNCGHKAFDEMLRQVALLLQSKIRSRDSLARLDGTRFSVMLENCEGDKGVEIAGSFVEAIEEFRFGWKGKSYSIGSNFGVVEINAGSNSADRVVDLADSAHRSSKQLGPNRVHRSALDGSAAAHKYSDEVWAKRIREGLDDQRFELHCQEVKSLGRPGVEQRFEVFLRLRDEEGKLVAPRVFLGAAVNAGLIGDLDRWVLTRAVTWLKEAGRPSTRVSVNISAQSMTDKRFPAFLQQLLKQQHMDPKRLCLEVTETAALDNLAKSTEFITVMQSIGCELALDNFGRGLTSFDHLRKLPVNYVKIDGPMVKRMTQDRVDYAVVKAIHRIAHAMGMKTVAQFVESEKAWEKLARIGVDYGQGYHIGEPAPLSELSRVINAAGAA